MNVLRSSVFWDVLMVVAGGFLLLEALGALVVGGPIWSVLFGAAGAGFVYVFSRSRENWWAAIPAGEIAPLLAVRLRCTWSLFGMDRHAKAKRHSEPSMSQLSSKNRGVRSEVTRCR